MSRGTTGLTVLAVVAAGLCAVFLAAAPLVGTAYTFHTYSSMVAELEQLATDHPALAEYFTAQDAYGLASVPDGAQQLVHPILRITNEALGLDKPEILLVGTQHGDEVVGMEVGVATARLLLESYGTDPWLTELVDRREIYILPLANPHGFNHAVRWSPGTESSSEDMNRDHLYDRDPCNFFCQDEDSLTTVGAQAIHQLARRHLFRVMLDYHGGTELIIHPWGTPLHDANDESPDDRVHDLLGQRMSSYGGPFNGFYPVGRSNSLLGSVFAPMDDTAYASSWDTANADPLWPTAGWRSLAYTVETSNQKTPPQSTLGGDASVLTPGGAEDGYVAKNVRIALATIDLIEPYVLWTNRAAVPTQIALGETVTVEWEVRGCFEVDDTHVRFGADPDPRVNFTGQSVSQQQSTGDPCFDGPTLFTAQVTPPAVGTWYLTPVAQVDSTVLTQGSPVPAAVSPRSWVARSRTEEGVLAINMTDPGEVNTVRGQLYWGAQPLAIQVGGSEIFSDGFESGNNSAWSSAVN